MEQPCSCCRCTCCGFAASHLTGLSFANNLLSSSITAGAMPVVHLSPKARGSRRRGMRHALFSVANRRFSTWLRKPWASPFSSVKVPVFVGIGVVGLMQARAIWKRNRDEEQPAGAPVAQRTAELVTKLPTRSLSRVWGFMNEITLPTPLRSPILGLYAWVFGCNLQEAENPNLADYPNLQSFFTRKLRRGIRPLAQSMLVSPADCRVLHFGPIEPTGMVEQVKGVTYSANVLIGQELPTPKPGNRLFHCILYLAPGDYHHYHAPARFSANSIKHFPGELLSVAPAVARMIRGLFNYNERVVLNGMWDYGQFHYCAVGAYNVGSMTLECKPDLVTNTSDAYEAGQVNEYPADVVLQKGETVGGFRLGSTIILVFEAPESFQFTVSPGQKLICGQALGDAPPSQTGC
eukprot:m.159973 g.159973  ORF g.159973 m.159973 type:complete len:406 (+) comp14344_c0_seq1:156-1373(+)